MKKTVIIFFLVFGIAVGAFCQSLDRQPIDLVVLLDTSVGMSNSHRETSEYLTGQFLREHLNLGDTFHLISFSSRPRLEISRRVIGR